MKLNKPKKYIKPNSKKVCIKGNRIYGSLIIDYLISLGGINDCLYVGYADPHYGIPYYYIEKNNNYIRISLQDPPEGYDEIILHDIILHDIPNELDPELYPNENKLIKSFIQVGDIIEIEYQGRNQICRVDEFAVMRNSDFSIPTEIVIQTKLSYYGSYGNIECTSDHFNYIRHIR